jgi:hypothetical protein
MYLQNHHADAIREAERKRGAEVVVFRVSGWLADIRLRIELALGECQAGRAS